MATQVLIAHTGQRLDCDTTQLSSWVDLSGKTTTSSLTVAASMTSRPGLLTTALSRRSMWLHLRRKAAA